MVDRSEYSSGHSVIFKSAFLSRDPEAGPWPIFTRPTNVSPAAYRWNKETSFYSRKKSIHIDWCNKANKDIIFFSNPYLIRDIFCWFKLLLVYMNIFCLYLICYCFIKFAWCLRRWLSNEDFICKHQRQNVIQGSMIGGLPYTVTPSIDQTLLQFFTITDLDLITEFDFLSNFARFP